MLQAIRDKAQGIFAWVLLVMIGVPFGLWGIQNYLDTGKEQPVAVVEGQEIFERDVYRVYEQSLANLDGAADYDEKRMKDEALERLINEELMARAAAEESLAIGDDEIRGVVQSLPYLQSDGKFDKEKYKIMLSSQGMAPAQFAARIRRALLLEQYQKGIAATAFVTSRQIESFYRLRNQERPIEYLTVAAKKSGGDFQDKDIEAYYREHLEEFQTPERVSVEYLSVSLDNVANAVQPTEEDLKALYEEQKSQFATPERRKVSHILIATEADKPESGKAARDKADDLRARLLKGEDFAKLAKEFSDDKDSGAKGGDLGFVAKESMDPNFAVAAFALQKDELSQPVKTPFGYHLIKLTELIPGTVKAYAEARDELAKNFQRTTAENKFYELSQTLTERSFEHPDSLEAAAKALNLEIERTELFARDAGAGIASEKAVRDAAFSQEVLDGKNSELVEIGAEKVYVLHLKDHELATPKPMAEVRQAIAEMLREKAARDDARKRAETLLTRIEEGQSLSDAAKSAGLSVSKATAKRIGETLPAPLSQAVFKAPIPGGDKKGGLGRVEMENGDQIVFNLLEVKEGATASVDPKELEMARDYMARNAGQGEFVAFLAQLRAQSDVYIKPAR
jgi:peptidyl-prolyl cis-trans isomerase D